MIDPTVIEAEDAIRAAYRAAADAEATLFLAYVGHGTYVGRDFYVLPRDASPTPSSRTGVKLVEVIKEEHQTYAGRGGLDGLVALIDACGSGVGALAVTDAWAVQVQGRPLRFEFLTSTDHLPAYDGCFTRELIRVLRDGLDHVTDEDLRCEHVRDAIEALCPLQSPQLPGFNPYTKLRLAPNVARRGRVGPFWTGTRAAEEVERLTACLEPTPALAAVVARSRESRAVVAVGEAGAGKSTLAAALARPELTGGIVPDGFAHAVAFLSGGMLTSDLAATLAVQLGRTVPDFAPARARFLAETPVIEQDKLTPIERDVLGPLGRLRVGEVRVVVDGLDQVATAAVGSVHAALTALATDPTLGRVRLVATSRPDTPVPPGAVQVPVDRAPDDALVAYLSRRCVVDRLHAPIVDRAGGNWLIARLLADRALATPDLDPAKLSGNWASIYAENLDRAGAASTQRWRCEFRPVLAVLAAAGTGPVLPMPLLAYASTRLVGPSRQFEIRDVLVDLRGLVVRDRPGADDERVGLFHQTLADYLLDPASGRFGIEPDEPHRALAEAIDALAPASSHEPADPLHRYAAAREAEHLWTIGARDRTLDILVKRSSIYPSENLRRWRSLEGRFLKELDSDHTIILLTRGYIAGYTGESGNLIEAIELFSDLLRDMSCILAPDHPEVLKTRCNLAAYTGEAGHPTEALQLFNKLLQDRLSKTDSSDPEVLTIRSNIVRWTGETGDAIGAVRLSISLIKDQRYILGPHHPDVMTTRGHLAKFTGVGGDKVEALRIYCELLADRERLIPPDHPDVLKTRCNIAYWIGESGNQAEALRLCQRLFPDLNRVFGLSHPYVLALRNNVAAFTAQAGNPTEALRLFEELKPAMSRALGPDDQITKVVQRWINKLKSRKTS